MKCKKCGTQFNGALCPNCGTKKKPFYLRWWFILIIVVLAGIVGLSLISSGERFAWNDIILREMLPAPPETRGKIQTNTAEKLYLTIADVSDKKYDEYLKQCKTMGFTVDAETVTSTYTAYNSKGYKLILSHYGKDGDMSIQVDAPIEMSTITWPQSVAGKQLPVPESDFGKFSYEHDDNFFVYIGNTSKDAYNAYVNACSDLGFNVDFDKGEKYYFADNSEGWHITLRYEGNNIMSIDIDAPKAEPTPTTVIPATELPLPAETPASAENNGLSPDFKAAMDSYEAFMDEYVAFMKKYKANPTDMTLISEYSEYMSKYADFVESFGKWESADMNTEETAYYLEVQARVSKKLLEVAN